MGRIKLEEIIHMIRTWMEDNGMVNMAVDFEKIIGQVLYDNNCLFRDPSYEDIGRPWSTLVIGIQYNSEGDALRFNVFNSDHNLTIDWVVEDNKLNLYNIEGCGGTGTLDSSYATTLDFKVKDNGLKIRYSDDATLLGTCQADIIEILREIDNDKENWVNLGYKILNAFKRFDWIVNEIIVEDRYSLQQALEWNNITGANIVSYCDELINNIRLNTEINPKNNPIRGVR